jgi:dihydroxy-acid dehydratase
MRSDIMKTGPERAPHRSLMFATGIRREDLGKPFIGVCNSYTDIPPGHCHLKDVGTLVC